MSHRFLALLCLGFFLLRPSIAQEDSEPDRFHDAFLDQLTGTWTMTGHVMGDSVTYEADAEWVLDHQFLRLRMEDVNAPPEYVAHVYIGYDGTDDQYLAHWLDDSGGRYSKTLGYGQREGEALTFEFDYPNGPFHTTFAQRAGETWHVSMRAKEDEGTWSTFAEFDVEPTSVR